MKLEEIGFYTLTDNRAKNASLTSAIWRCEIILTDKCNFRCPYCKGLRNDCKGILEVEQVKKMIDYNLPLKNIRFSGGEPTQYPFLVECIKHAKKRGCERIAISTNGSANISYYKKLIEEGVNDFSISLDACCSSFGKKMCGGIDGMWERVVNNIREMSKLTYVTLGMVFTDETIDTVVDVVKFGSSLDVADIRIISSAQDNKMLPELEKIPQEILNKHPILHYRVKNFISGRNVRGFKETDSCKCGLVIDDIAIAGNYHFPCIIYLREGGNPIGIINKKMRSERFEWFKSHNTHNEPICKNSCLDVCIDYNNKYRRFHEF